MEDQSPSSPQQQENELNNNVNLEEDFDNLNQLDDFQNDDQNDFDQVTPNQNLDNPAEFNQDEQENIASNKISGNQTNQQMPSNANIQENNFFGINKTLYQNYPDGKKVSQQVKTGTDFVLLPRNPEFVFETEPFETLYAPKQDILENSLRREIEKFCFADTLLNKIVYDSIDPSIFTKDIDPRNYELEVMPFYIPTSNSDKTLVFESRFESGNLRRAIQLLDFEYNLILKPDSVNQGNTQWFYFSVANTRKNQEYRFNIINMMKPDSLYNQGMKPLVYSEKFAKFQKIGWFRDGNDICYYQNNMKRKTGGYYYTLTFSIKFQYDYDTVYFSHCYPYTYTQLNKFITKLEKDPSRKNKLKKKLLCQTIAQNPCYYLVITEFQDGKNENKNIKKTIILSSRIHPGESMSSYIIENVIDFLTGYSVEAKILRENFIFKVIPMLNIDGVVNGNYRCNLAGVDLNRQWLMPVKSQHPTIYYARQLIKKCKEEKNLILFCDFHGHSRKKNIFMYGCSGKDNYRREMVFPLLIRNNCPVFQFKDCSFAIQKEREGSARVINNFSSISLNRQLFGKISIQQIAIRQKFRSVGRILASMNTFILIQKSTMKLLGCSVIQQQIALNQNKQKLKQ